jgi:hypothetical protein
MEIASTSLDVSGGSKSTLWDRMKRKNTSSPSLHKVGIKNWSTRSLPRFGTFGSSSGSVSNGHSPKSSNASSPTSVNFAIPEECQPKKQQVVKDYFSGLPNEVKLQILSYLPVKAIAKASTVSSNFAFLIVGVQAMADIVR